MLTPEQIAELREPHTAAAKTKLHVLNKGQRNYTIQKAIADFFSRCVEVVPGLLDSLEAKKKRTDDAEKGKRYVKV